MIDLNKIKLAVHKLLTVVLMAGVIGSFGAIEQGQVGVIWGVGQAFIFLLLACLSYKLEQKTLHQQKRKRAQRTGTSLDSQQQIHNQ